MTERSATTPLPTKPPHGQSVQITRDPDQARTHQKRRSAALQRTHKSQISIAPALNPAGSFFGDFRTPAGVRNSSRQPPVRFRASDATMRTLASGGRFGSYSNLGRPSVDPDLMIRMLIVGYCFGIRSALQELPPGNRQAPQLCTKTTALILTQRSSKASRYSALKLD